jgi:CDP-diacylglycerol--serine O-phosphatidyltransferase
MAASLVIFFHHMGGTGTIKKVSVLLLIYVLAGLMVSNIRYYAFKDPELFRRQPFGFLVLAIIFIIVIVAQPEIMIFALACLFISSGPVGTVLKRFRKPSHPAEPPTPAAS